ncbi:SnoaL-like domain protein [Stieleria maiorica]|uniref:SnoaL-like domain protein n=1 Tax=Stieleria maiorica TaxID=2795974 RepID=A0A5B9MQ63_9BACT|nr:SnoaL-like domain protein [Stieleria maiorica]
MKRVTLALMAAALVSLCVRPVAADQAADEATIRKDVAAYVAAFNQGDAKALASMWSPEAVYTNPLSGEQVVGREAIEQQFAAIFAENKGVKLSATTQSVQFISPSVALETGTAAVIRPEQEPEESEYTAVYVKRDGAWLLDRVTEEDVPVVVSNEDHLKDLQWMIGSWVDQDDRGRVETTCQWTKNRNFMVRMFSMVVGDQIEQSGMQIIGWDAAAGQIRSWVFDSRGGFSDGVWEQKDKKWYIQSTGTMHDGSKMSATNILTYVDDNTLTWQSINRIVDGELLPNVDEVVAVRAGGVEGSQ